MSTIRDIRVVLLRLLAVMALGAAVAACGVKGAPEAPAGERAAYPRTYPKSNRYPPRVETETETEDEDEAPRQIDPATGEPLDREDVETVEEDDDDI